MRVLYSLTAPFRPIPKVGKWESGGREPAARDGKRLSTPSELSQP